MEVQPAVLTDRQKRELEYHRHHASEHAAILGQPFSYDVVTSHARRWWNAYWEMFSLLLEQDLRDRAVLVVGCGFGSDALRLAKMGARVSAFDLSAESLDIARQLAAREGLDIDFREMPCESLGYESGYFDCIVARDILHHVDIPVTMRELVRVARKNALIVIDEIYSHSVTNKVRHSRIVEKYAYPIMQKFVYGGVRPYITEDERKLNEEDIAVVVGALASIEVLKYFNVVVNRVVPETYTILNKLDRLLLRGLHPVAHILAGRILMAGRTAA